MARFLDTALNGGGKYAGKALFFRGPKWFQYDWDKDQGSAGTPPGLDKWGFPAPFDKGIDAAVEGREGYVGKAYFFKDDKFLSYDWAADKVDSAAKGIVDEWGIPAGLFAGKKKIDAAVNGVGDCARYCYLFSGTNWVRYDWQGKEPVELHKGLGDWKLPSEMLKGFDAALSGWGPDYGDKTYFFLDKRYARYNWSADKCDETTGDLGSWKMPLADVAPQVTGGDPQGPDIVPQAWNGRTGRIWVPTGASGTLPLLVCLHGNSRMARLWGAQRMLADDATLPKDDASLSLGNLATKLMALNKIKPLVIAAPSDRLEDLTPDQGTLWNSLNLGAFIDDVVKRANESYGVKIDLKRVGLMGHSGAGCFLKNGIDKVAHQGGWFSAGGANNMLMLIGFADTETTSKYSTSVQKGLRDVGNTTTVIYSIHKDRGGNNNGDDAAYAEGYGVTRKLIDLPKAPRLPKVPLVTGQSLLGSTENDDQDAFTFYADNGTADTPPTRTVAKVDGKNIYRHLGDFLGAKAIDKNNRQDHGTMPLVWAWYALPRFYK